jgi:hypothetical protein
MKPASQAGLAVQPLARVSAANTLAINFINDTAAPIVPTAAEVWQLLVFRPFIYPTANLPDALE